MIRYQRQLDEAAGAVTVLEHGSYRWLGALVRPAPATLREHLTEDQLLGQARLNLTADLYRNLYQSGGVARPRQAAAGASRGSPEFVTRLSAANQGLGAWDPGWTLTSRRADDVTVTKSGLTLRTHVTEVGLSPAPGAALGTEVRLPLGKESFTRSPGYYVALGDLGLDGDDTLRLYWHLTPLSALRWVRLATGVLNDRGIPFALKVLSQPAHYVRADAGVLYLPGDAWPEYAATVAELYAEVRAGLRATVPAFTKELRPGLGLAEDPEGGTSFGTHRCRLMAEGLLAGPTGAGRAARQGRREVTGLAFISGGVDPDRPYLRAGAADRYDLDRPRVGTRDRDGTQGRDGAEGGDRAAVTEGMAWSAEAALEVALSIGAHLARSAVWVGEECTWVGTEPAVPGSDAPTTVAPLGAGLFGGTAGVGLFLAEAAAAGQVAELSRAARGALLHACRRAADASDVRGPGLFTGTTGVALAAARGGALLEDPGLLEAARRSLEATGRSVADGFDLLSGTAGRVVGLVALARLLPVGDDLLEKAAREGERLLDAADRHDGALSWTTAEGGPALTGLSHGASGGALAFLELLAATGDQRWAEAARAAMAFERGWFSTRHGNWRDRRRGHGPFMTAWCHGAPGIGLVRLRAAELLPSDSAVAGDLSTAVATTRRTVEAELANGGDFSLCHGLAGRADILLEVGRRLGDQRALDLAASVATTGRSTYAAAPRLWPCASPGPAAPGLMFGLSGIGLHYLRSALTTVPGVLLPRPDGFARPPAAAARTIVVTSAFDGVVEGVAAAPAVVTPPARSGSAPRAPQGLTWPRLVDTSPDEVATFVRHELGRRGFRAPDAAVGSSAVDRWETGRRLWRGLVTTRLPDFADLWDLLGLPDTDEHLWHSLPTMLAFGWEQGLLLSRFLPASSGAGSQVESSARQAALDACALVSAILSVFDHLVDEAGQADPVFAMEADALRTLTRPAEGTAALAAHAAAAADPGVRTLLVLFACASDRLRVVAEAASPAARRALTRCLTALFDAERRCTLDRPTSLQQLTQLARLSRRKSVLPFVALGRILVASAPPGEPAVTLLTSAAAVGRAISLTDDLVDLPDDLPARAPSPVVLRVVRRSAAMGSPDLTLDQVSDVLRRGVDDLWASLDRRAFGPRDGSLAGPADALHAFTLATVSRWVRDDSPQSTHGGRTPSLSTKEPR